MAVYLGSNQVDLLGGDGIPSAYLIPSGTYSISQNGTYDVGSYKSASVDLPYYGIYKARTNTNQIYANGSSEYSYTSTDVQKWINSYSSIIRGQMAGLRFFGSFYFNNVTSIDIGAFQGFYDWTIFPDGDLYFPQVQIVPSNAFSYARIEKVYLPSCTRIYGNAFGYALTTQISAPNCNRIDTETFYSCNIIEANFPNCSYVGPHAFEYCYKLTSINFPICSSIDINAFYHCGQLVTVNLPQCSIVDQSAFTNCYTLSSIYLPECTTIGYRAFEDCTTLQTISCPSLITISDKAFSYCTQLSSLFLPACTSIRSSAFNYCSNLSIVSLPACTSIGGSAFAYCYNLLSLYLLGSSIPSLYYTEVFYYTPLSSYTTSTGGVYGSIYVPASLYNDYLSASYWSAYSARIVSLTDEQIAALG